MPSWKRVIVSGSDASLNSLNVTTNVVAQSFTGSLFGTSSWSQNSLTASFVTSSNVMGPLGNNSVLSASFALTASHAINITVSGSINGVDYIDFDTTMSYTNVTGRLGWDSGEHTLQLGLDGGVVQYSLGEQLYQYCYNAESTTLTKGEIVYVSGSQGNQISVKRANNSGDDSSAGTLGFVAETIISGGSGWILTEGVLRKLNTNGLTAGGLLYLGATPGTYTQTPPVAPSHSVRLGYVERVNSTVGSIYVKIDNGYEIGELHDVVDNTTTTTHGDLLIKSGSVWRNAKQLTGSYGLTGSLTATQGFTGSLFGTASNVQGGAANYIPLWNTNSTLSSSVMYQSSSNVGIGTSTPTQKLDVRGILGIGIGSGSNQPALTIESVSTGGSNHTHYFRGISDGTNDGVFWDLSRGGGAYGLFNISFFNTTRLSIAGSSLENNGDSYVQPFRNFGVNTTTPAAKLHISGSSSEVLLIASSSAGPALYVSGSGNVGIGTSSPSQKLEVQGQVQVGNDSINNAGIIIARRGASHQARSHYYISSPESPTYQWIEGGIFTGEMSGTSFANNSGKPYYEQYVPAGYYKSFGFINQTTSGSAFTNALATASITLYQGGDIALAPILGNVGIGTITPNVRLEVAGLGRFTGTSGFSIGGDNNQNRIQYSTSTFSRFALLNSGNSYTGLSALQLSIGGVYGDTDAPASGMIVQGNVGIGTTSPSARLHISGSTNSILRIESQDGSDTTPTVYIEGNKNLGSPATATLVELRSNDDFRGRGIHMTVSGSNTRWFAGVPYTGNGYSIGYDASSNGLPWYAASSSLFINTSRNVGIGTTSPSARLHVAADNNGLFVRGANTSPFTQNIAEFNYGGNNNSVVIKQLGGVASITTSPNANLQLSASGSGQVVVIDGKSVGFNNTANSGVITLQNTAASGQARLDFITGSTTVMSISGSGNVGIGTSSPLGLLHVNGGDSYFGAETNTATSMVFRRNAATRGSIGTYNGQLEFSGGPVLGSGHMVLTSTGNVGIGTISPNARLDVSGSAIVSGSFTVAPSNAVELQVSSTGVRLGNVVTDVHTVTGSLNVGGGITGSLFGTSSWSNNSISASFAVSAAWAPTAGTTVFPYTGSALFTGSITLTGSLNVSGSATITDSLTIAGSTFSGSVGTRLSIVSGTLSIAPYTSSGMIRVSDASGWPVAANYTYPQLRLPDYRTGITLVSNNEVHIVCDSNGVMSAKSGIGNHFVNLDSTAWLRWSTSTTNGFTHDIILKRESAGVLAITGSVRISGSLNVSQGFTSSIFGTASWADNALTASNVLGGAANYIPLWNGATSLSSSVIYQSSGNVGIGTITPGARLDVSGSAIISGSFTVSPSNAVELQVTSTGVMIGSSDTDVHQITGSVNIKGNIIGAEPIPAGAKLYLYYNY